MADFYRANLQQNRQRGKRDVGDKANSSSTLNVVKGLSSNIPMREDSSFHFGNT